MMDKVKANVLILEPSDLKGRGRGKRVEDLQLTDFIGLGNGGDEEAAELILFVDRSRFRNPKISVLKSRWARSEDVAGGTEESAGNWFHAAEDLENKYIVASNLNKLLILVIIVMSSFAIVWGIDPNILLRLL